MQTEVDTVARMLELSDVRREGRSLTGRRGALRLHLTKDQARIAFSRAQPFSAVMPKLPGPRLDEVESWDEAFDAEVSVLATPDARAICHALLASPAVRGAMRAALAAQARVTAYGITVMTRGSPREAAFQVNTAVALAELLEDFNAQPAVETGPAPETGVQRRFRRLRAARTAVDLFTLAGLLAAPFIGVASAALFAVPALVIGWKCPACRRPLEGRCGRLPDGRCPSCGELLAPQAR